MKRREFIRVGSAAGAGAVALGGLTTRWYDLYADPIPDPGTDGDTVVPSFCELCFWKCGILAHVKNGRVTKIQGNPKDPLSNGMLCPRGTGGTGLLYDPDRLKRPMIRRAKRGSQVFEEVSWDDALNETARHFDRIRSAWGPGALALFLHGYGGNWMKHLFKAYGSPNIAAPSYAQCRGPREIGFALTFGTGIYSPEVTDMQHSRCLVLIGNHLGENMHNTQVQEFATAVRNHADIIVVDPRFSVAASKARYWLPIKPGTDLALLLAWMHVIIGEGLYDREYLTQYAIGLEQLTEHVKPYSPEWAFPRTGIEPEVIRQTARVMAAARPATLIHPGRHVTWYGNDTQRSRAIAILNALMGSWGRRGGFYIPSQIALPPYPYPAYEKNGVEVRDRPEPSQYPLADEALAQGICEATIPGIRGEGRIKGWMVYGSNLPSSLPNPQQTYQAIEELEFLVTVDVLPAEIVGWSDVVLPEATYLERCDELLNPYFRQPYVAVRQPAVEPMYESKPGWWIARELANRLGLEDFFPWQDSVEYAKTRLTAAGYDCHVLQRDGVVLGEPQPLYFEEGAPAEFYTDSGKIELYSAQLAALGFDPMPAWHQEDVEDPPTGYYRLLSGRAPMHTFGRTTNNRLLSEVFDENSVWVNASVAAQWGLRDGERVYLRNQDGVRSTFSAPVKVTERIHPDAVYMVHGYGHKAKGLKFAYGRGIDDTELVTRYKTDPIMGGTGMNVNFVTFVRASDVAAEAAEGAAAAGAVAVQGGSAAGDTTAASAASALEEVR
jgi:thiosulfate reductase/polysulfide reductase chain A